jgi:hypothetical protein
MGAIRGKRVLASKVAKRDGSVESEDEPVLICILVEGWNWDNGPDIRKPLLCHDTMRCQSDHAVCRYQAVPAIKCQYSYHKLSATGSDLRG